MFSKLIGLIFIASFMITGTANAQTLTLRGEAGVAFPLTEPQTKHFDAGGAVAVKPELSLGSYFSLGPSFQAIALPSRVATHGDGSALSYGMFLRVKRPHDSKNTGRGLSAVSPWVDTDLKAVSTGSLTRFGGALAVGASVPTDDSRALWVGPFARYDIVNQEDGKFGVNTNSAKTLIVGLSLEFGAPVQRARKPNPVPRPVPAPTPGPVPCDHDSCPMPEPSVVVMHFKPRIQFAWDSAELWASQKTALADVVRALEVDKALKVRVEGHASSEGQVEHNNRLSERRAQSVVDFLVANGVDRSRLTVKGFGSSVPVADNKTEAGRVMNRRVEFDVTFTLTKAGE